MFCLGNLAPPCLAPRRCCSLLGEVRRQQADGTPSSSDPSSGSSEQEAAAEAAMVAHAKKCRGPALERLKHQPMLDALVEVRFPAN